MPFGSDQSVLIISYIYIDNLIKPSIDIHCAFKITAATLFIVFNMHDILYVNIQTSNMYSFIDTERNSGAYGEEVVKKNMHSQWYCAN